MGAGQSTAQDHPPTRALHVLRVTPSSPASETTIEPFFDFVVGYDEGNDSLNAVDAAQLERIVEEHEGSTLNLLVWSSKNKMTRVVPITPSRAWAMPNSLENGKTGNGSNEQPSLLGLSMRMCEPQLSTDNVWHVMDVLEGSPAESAGLVPYGDWIIGWSGGVLSAENDFYDLVEAHIDKPLRLYVYSYDFDTLREAVVVPNHHWGGEGLLGCVFGFGLIHRIPAQQSDRQPGTTPPELSQLNQEYEKQDLFVPADAHNHDDHDHDHRHGSLSPSGARGYIPPRSPGERRQSSETVTGQAADVPVHTPTPHNHAGQFDGHSHSARSPTPTRISSGSFTNGDSAPHP
ncbi:hypothetical protein FIBSPDRAFT_945044 [Athelia psychrophila]|uniref:PDZ GRASP-type domain-containing protein n=1 Tax=Athelia psychrophila TaxID=1759441 RepID=A0A166UB85_9AGAM|nr:hypothetical protein FIBSPDRAFT_945044 [Fibularhizoctonia sp. CBS 109695]